MYFFLSEVTMFFSVPGTSSRHCQSGGIRAHETPGCFKFFVRLGTSLIFFCIPRSTNRNGAFPPHFLSLDFPYQHSEISLLIFIMPCQYFQSNECTKKTRNSRGEISAMETHLYTMFFFNFFHKNFPMNTQIDFLHFFMPCQYFQSNEC